MSLITRCPACMTLFRVVPDQLRISDGWVRCGHCDEVFDGNLHLQTQTQTQEQPSPPVPPDAAVPQDQTAPAEAADSQSAPYDWGEVLEPPPPPEERDNPQHEELAQEADSDATGHDQALDAEPQFLPAQGEEPAWRAELDVVPEPLFPAFDGTDPQAVAVPPEAAPTFMQAPSGPAGQPERNRLRLLALSLVLGLMLMAQLLLQERDVLAAAYPSSKPVLQTVCGWLGCEIRAPRQIDALQIESSAFAKVRPDVYQLQFTLRNTAGTELALPAMELTLTDATEQPVLRKVFPVESFALAQDSLPASGDVSVSIPVTVVAAGLGERIAGYRLLAFYP